MSNSDQNGPRSADALDLILREARARNTVPEEARKRAFENLHRQWRKATMRKRVIRLAIPFAAAASLLVALFMTIGPTLNTDLSTGVQVAEVARLTGDEFKVSTEDGVVSMVESISEVLAGQRIETGPDTLIALRWTSGGTLRIDENSAIEFHDTQTVRLLSGAVYYDSYSYDSQESAEVNALLIRSDFATMRHVGTQYAARVNGSSLVVQVREGIVRIETASGRHQVNSETEAFFDASGRTFQQTLSPAADAWRWVELVTPEFPAEGKTPLQILEWAARETGRELRFSSQTARDSASTGSIAGLGDSSPRQALVALAYIADLRIDEVGDTVEVGVVD